MIYYKCDEIMGKLIVIEGACDGIGKSTQYGLLRDYLKKDYPDVNIVTHHFPSYNTEQGSCVEMYLNGKFGSPENLSPYFINALYAVDRAVTWNLELKKTYYKDGVILLDRYTTSSLIYQTAFMKNEVDKKAFIDYVVDFEYNKLGIQKPDEVFFLYAPYDLVTKMRKERNTSTDIHENKDEYQKIFYENALFIANYLNWTWIDCSMDNNMKSIESIHEEIKEKTEAVLGKNR